MVKLVFGVGINDMAYGSCSYTEDGKSKKHKFYDLWKSMLCRCYDPKFHERQPTYIGCSVCDEWLMLSKFKKWFDKYYVDGYELDKDFVSSCNKVYSPETCNFIPKLINTFIIDAGASRGEYPIGAYWHKKDKVFMSKCRNPFTKKTEYLGSFTTPEAAHNAWKARKHELAIQLSEVYVDLPECVLERLKTMYK